MTRTEFIMDYLSPARNRGGHSGWWESVEREIAALETDLMQHATEAERLRAYAVALRDMLGIVRRDYICDETELADKIDAALARNPVTTGGQSSIAALVAERESTPEGKAAMDRARERLASRLERWPQGDPYPWIVREPSGQCWGPFATNKAASQWADDNQIATCDFEDVMPPPDSRHQSCTQFTEASPDTIEDCKRLSLVGWLREITSGWLWTDEASSRPFVDALIERGKELEQELRHQVGRDVQPFDYEATVRAFHAWLDSRPAGFSGEDVVNPGGRWFDAFVAGARSQSVACKEECGCSMHCYNFKSSSAQVCKGLPKLPDSQSAIGKKS